LHTEKERNCLISTHVVTGGSWSFRRRLINRTSSFNEFVTSTEKFAIA
jgi:hypothetical protein